jgi:hypothetical protein
MSRASPKHQPTAVVKIRPSYARDLTIREIVREVVFAEMAKLLIRCRECGKFSHPGDAALLACRCCFQGIFAFCDACGGEDRAKSSVRAHVRYFASKPARHAYGDAHHHFWAAHQERLHRKLRTLP